MVGVRIGSDAADAAGEGQGEDGVEGEPEAVDAGAASHVEVDVDRRLLGEHGQRSE